MVNLGICSTSLEPLPGDGYLYREASISDHRTYLSLVECNKMSFVIIILTLKFFFNSLLLNLQQQIILINFMSNQQD